MSIDPAVEWLLHSDEPAIRYLTRREILGEPADDDAQKILAGPKVATLLASPEADGWHTRKNPYSKWVGIHWRLVSLVELAVPRTDPRVATAAEQELDWISRQRAYRERPYEVDGLARLCASVGGNALAVCSRLGLADDRRTAVVAETLMKAQWPDGGWNCHPKATGRRSSFHESLSTSWGLYEYAKATGDTRAEQAAFRAAELFLQHRVVLSLGSGQRGRPHPRPAGKVINPQWLEQRYPSYWRYDLLQALLILSRMGKVTDPRASDALDELERRRRPDGRWAADGRWWNPPGSGVSPEAVEWGKTGQPNEMITLNALRVLKAAGRFVPLGR